MMENLFRAAGQMTNRSPLRSEQAGANELVRLTKLPLCLCLDFDFSKLAISPPAGLK